MLRSVVLVLYSQGNINFWLPRFGEHCSHSKLMSPLRLRPVPAQFDRSQENAFSAAKLPHRPVETRSAEEGLLVCEEQLDYARDWTGRSGRYPFTGAEQSGPRRVMSRSFFLPTTIMFFFLLPFQYPQSLRPAFRIRLPSCRLSFYTPWLPVGSRPLLSEPAKFVTQGRGAQNPR